jgi:hypothetical protein
MVAFLLSKGANIHQRTRNGENALYAAAFGSSFLSSSYCTSSSSVSPSMSSTSIPCSCSGSCSCSSISTSSLRIFELLLSSGLSYETHNITLLRKMDENLFSLNIGRHLLPLAPLFISSSSFSSLSLLFSHTFSTLSTQIISLSVSHITFLSSSFLSTLVKHNETKNREYVRSSGWTIAQKSMMNLSEDVFNFIMERTEKQTPVSPGSIGKALLLSL